MEINLNEDFRQNKLYKEYVEYLRSTYRNIPAKLFKNFDKNILEQVINAKTIEDVQKALSSTKHMQCLLEDFEQIKKYDFASPDFLYDYCISSHYSSEDEEPEIELCGLNILLLPCIVDEFYHTSTYKNYDISLELRFIKQATVHADKTKDYKQIYSNRLYFTEKETGCKFRQFVSIFSFRDKEGKFSLQREYTSREVENNIIHCIDEISRQKYLRSFR